MQKIRLIDGTTLNVENVNIVSGDLRITSKEKTAEELQDIFKNKENLHTIEFLTENGKLSGTRTGFVCYGGLDMFDDLKTVHLLQETDKDSERITEALAKALAANTQAGQANADAAEAKTISEENSKLIDDLIIAMLEV